MKGESLAVNKTDSVVTVPDFHLIWNTLTGFRLFQKQHMV